MAYQTSQGLASLGRNGDSMLVHMNPTEVAGLQSLAMSQGGSLTINPHTGLPEAFSLGGFFKSLLPVFAGAATGGAGMPLWAGIAAGAVTGAATNKDRLMGALTGGLGGYGGYGLGQGLVAAGAPTVAPNITTAGGYVPGTVEGANTALNVAGTYSPALSPATTNAVNAMNAAGFTGSAGTGATGIDKSFLGGMDRIGPGIKQMGTGVKNIATSQPGAWDAFKSSFVEPGAKPISDLAAYGKIGMPIGGAALGGLEPSDIYGEPIDMDAAKKKQAYDPNATLNLSGDTGLRLYATGGTIQSGGIRDLYGTPDNQPTISPGLSGFGLGRLNNLAGEQALNQAQTLGYADGGDVVAGERGMNLTDLPSLNVNTGEQGYGGKSYYMTPDGSGMYAGRFFKDAYRQSPNPLFKLFSQLPNDKVFTRQMAQGGPVSFADGGDSDKEDVLGLPSLSPDMSIDSNAGAGNLAMIQSAMQPTQGMQGNAPMAQGQMPDQSNDSLIAKVTANLKADPNYQPENPIEAAIVKQIRGTDPMQQGQPSPQGLGSLAPSQPMAPSYNPSQSMAPSFNPSTAMGPTYFAGINAPQGYADGGDVVAGEKSMNLDELPSLNLNFVTRPSESSSENSSRTQVLADMGRMYTSENKNPFVMGTPPQSQTETFLKSLDRPTGIKLRPYYEQFMSNTPGINAAQPKSYALNLNSGQQKAQYAQGGETSLNLDDQPTLNVNTGKQSYNTIQSALANSDNPQGRLLNRMFSFRPGGRPSIYDQFTAQGLGRLNNSQMAKGGYLDGQGDGMSDSIPATIEGKQPARLADGEFVVPADVVSHIGNGSSKAGSKRLYAMLDKVRKARTGHTKQGKQIKPEKYMPA